MTLVADLPLRGAGGEPIDLARTIVSHGVAELPPNRVDLEARTLERRCRWQVVRDGELS